MPLFICCLVFLVFAPAAHALEVEFEIKSSHGKPLSNVMISAPEGRFNPIARTDISGRARADLDPGRTYLVGRSNYWLFASGRSGNGCKSPEESAPEGKGFTYTAPRTAPPEAVQIVLPAVEHPDYRPDREGQGRAERAFVGLLNQRRAELGLRPLEISRNLSYAADSYAHFSVRGNNADRGSHCRIFGPEARRSDVGFGGIHWENSHWGGGGVERSHARRAFDGFMNSPPHRESLLDGSFFVIGVGYAAYGGSFHIEAWPGTCFARGSAELLASCQLTGDLGDVSLAFPESSPGSGPLRLDPGLSLVHKRVRSRHIWWHIKIHPDLSRRDILLRARGPLRRGVRLWTKRGRLIAKTKRARGRLVVRVPASSSWRADRLVLRLRAKNGGA